MSRRAKWTNGDVFAVPLSNGQFVIGQVLDLMMSNVVRLALYEETVSAVAEVSVAACCQATQLISLVASTREQLDYRVWSIVGNKPVSIPIERYPNEQFRSKGWVGAKVYDASIIASFLEAFYALQPWDDWFSPAYLDELLVHLSKKPEKLILIK